MTQGRIWLGRPGMEILMPHLNRTFVEQDTEISTKSRTASGRLVEDIVAVKKVFNITYGTLKDEDLEALKELYKIGDMLSLKVERNSGNIETYTVKMSPFNRQRLIIATRWYWNGVTITLEEV